MGNKRIIKRGFILFTATPHKEYKYSMRFFEFKPLKPLTPQQARIATLKKNAEIAKQTLAREKKAQQIQKAQATIRKNLAIN
jgi:hypothetical protein